MNRLLPLFLATCSMVTAGCGRCDIAALGDPEIEELLATRASLKQAMLDGDVETLKRSYSEDYGLVTRKGSFRSRTERLEMLETGKLRYLHIGEESEIDVNTYGSVAVVRGVVGSSQTEFDGERREPGPRRFTEVWVHENGRWLAVGRQATAIAEFVDRADSGALRETSTEIEEEIWALEETYMAAFREADHEVMLALLHDGFLGWPAGEEKPRDKTAAELYLQKNHAQPFEGSVAIDHAGIVVLGDVVMTHYLVTMSAQGKDGVQAATVFRITHTWIKDGPDWKILGGMSTAL